ncbi:MAG: ATP synthase F1 subunit delta [Acholeplasmatales bacterium]|jgi:F-type H+-transporting ATPase subunit delta|nr:ATP synthase F1 subunit delta [Acholeplasmatales bacterium]
MIANEYAKAIFELAQANSEEELVNDNFNLFVKLLNDNPDFLKVLTYPRITLADKKDAIKNTLIDFEPIFIDFLFVLLDNNRMDMIKEIAFEYEQLILADNGAVKVDVYSASLLTKKEILSVEETLKKAIGQKRIIIYNYVDESLIGGIKAVYNGRSLDLSLNNQLSHLKKSI